MCVSRFLHPPLGYVFKRRLSESLFKTCCECGARHARRFGQGFDRPWCIHTVVNGTQGSAHLRIETRTKPSLQLQFDVFEALERAKTDAKVITKQKRAREIEFVPL